jgi:hypothetical protein
MRKIFLILLILIFAAAFKVEAQTCSVSGRIVDDKGNPISEAYINTDGYYRDDIDVIYVTHIPEKDGTFNIESNCGENGTAYLWISQAYNYWENFAPVKPPFRDFPGKLRRYPLFAGIPFKGRNVKLGDVKIQILYQKVRVNLQNESGAALFPDRKDLANITFTIKNERGVDMTSQSSPSGDQLKNENTLRDSSVLMSLPEGKWIIEIHLPPGKRKKLYPDKLVEVKNPGAPEIQEVALRLSGKKFKP